MGHPRAVVIDGVTLNVGQTVTLLIRGDGPLGAFTGRVAAVTGQTLRLVLTQATGPFMTGAIVDIDRDEIVAISPRVEGMFFG